MLDNWNNLFIYILDSITLFIIVFVEEKWFS